MKIVAARRKEGSRVVFKMSAPLFDVPGVAPLGVLQSVDQSCTRPQVPQADLKIPEDDRMTIKWKPRGEVAVHEL